MYTDKGGYFEKKKKIIISIWIKVIFFLLYTPNTDSIIFQIWKATMVKNKHYTYNQKSKNDYAGFHT